MTQMFNKDEMIRATREGMENSMKFFMTMNENLIKFSDLQRETANEATKKSIEMANKACEDYQKNTRIVVSHIENMWKNAIDQLAPKAKSAE